MPDEKPCPVCGTNAILRPIQAGMKLALQQSSEVDSANLPPEACPPCYAQLSGQVSQGAKLRAEIVHKQKNKEAIWKSRVLLVKKARLLMGQKSFMEAATHYEKYLRVLEVAYDLEKGQLNPGVFSNSKKSKELTVVTSTYWDLFRIYDRSPKTTDKMRATGLKLAEFIRYSTIYSEIMKKADSFQRTAKHKAIAKEFVKQAGGKKGGCYIATAAYDNPYSWQIAVLRQYRDRNLRTHFLGRQMIYFYYKTSPRLVSIVKRWPLLRFALRIPLRVIVAHASLSLKIKGDS